MKCLNGGAREDLKPSHDTKCHCNNLCSYFTVNHIVWVLYNIFAHANMKHRHGYGHGHVDTCNVQNIERSTCVVLVSNTDTDTCRTPDTARDWSVHAS